MRDMLFRLQNTNTLPIPLYTFTYNQAMKHPLFRQILDFGDLPVLALVQNGELQTGHVGMFPNIDQLKKWVSDRAGWRARMEMVPQNPTIIS
jgi:hypothetical protein